MISKIDSERIIPTKSGSYSQEKKLQNLVISVELK